VAFLLTQGGGSGVSRALTLGTIGASSLTLRTANTDWWTLTSAGEMRSAQGTLTGASTPFLSHTATWNNAGTVFTNILSNVTNTASSTSSLLIDLQVGGASKFSVSRTGVATLQWSTMVATGSYEFVGLTRMKSSADGLLNLFNAGETGFTRLNLGGITTGFTGISASAPVSSNAQGIIIQRADGTPQVFANLGAATNGSVIYCSDCTFANPCAGSGTGAYAKRLNGVWRCD